MPAATLLAFATERIRSKLLEGMSSAERHAVLAAANQRDVPAGTVVTHQGDAADYFYMVLRGCAQHFYLTPQGKRVGLFWLSPGEIFGGAAMLPIPFKYLAGTEVVKPSRLLVWHRDQIRELAGRFPRLLDNALVVVSDYFTWYLAAHLSLTCQSARERLAHVLFSLADCIGEQHADGVHIEITNEQLAGTANITIFTASRLLSEWQRTGAIAKARGKIVLRSPQQLFVTNLAESSSGT